MKISYCFLLFLFIGHANRVISQENLILNSGFEQHNKTDCLQCNLYGKYPAFVPHWDNMGWGCVLCDKDYKQNSDELKSGFCPFDQIAPYAGKTMISMQYVANCNGKHGAASRLCTRPEQILQVGHLFEISFWLYIPSNPRADPDWSKHIGIVISPQKMSLNTFVADVSHIPTLPIDTVILDSWYQVKWEVRPLCNSNYLMIGVFGDREWPVSQNYPSVLYYVDNVNVKELPTAFISPDSIKYYCSQYDPEKNADFIPRLDDIYLFFDPNNYNLTEEHKTMLDSVARFLKRYPDMVFEISGHTDSIGSENEELSQNRAKAVLQYLTEVQKLPELRFVSAGLSSNSPLLSNNTESGRKSNRRVEISQTNMDLNAIYYRKAVQNITERKFSESFSNINKWLRNAGQKERMILLFDPRFDILKKDKRWTLIEKSIHDRYRLYKYANYAFLMDSLQMDYSRVMGRLTWEFCELPSDSVFYQIPALTLSEIDKKLKEHFLGLLPICEKIGWPKRSEFGGGTSASAFYILQHSGDTVACMNWLPVFQKKCEEGEASWEHYAMLYDRCNIYMGKPQRYGTQFKVMENGEIGLYPCEGDEYSINKYRRNIGLSDIQIPATFIKKR